MPVLLSFRTVSKHEKELKSTRLQKSTILFIHKIACIILIHSIISYSIIIETIERKILCQMIILILKNKKIQRMMIL